MLYKLFATILVSFFLVAGNSIAQETEIDPKPQKTNKLFPIMLECDAKPEKIFGLIQDDYDEKPFGAGNVIVRSAITGQFFAAEAFMLVNPDTLSFSIVGIFADGSGCMLINGKGFTPYVQGEKT
tara:strand:+ start:2769 stop:3143 length:375 start_codon:yes stop_codon:yes gene_type:complete